MTPEEVREMVPLSRHEITEADMEAVVAALRSGRLSQGERTCEFESAVARFVGAKYGVAVSSGTAALHLLMVALDLKPGDEVITTPFSYVASTNCIFYVGARPVFVDIDETTLNLDPRLLGSVLSPRTKAILPVHVFGRPCEMDEVLHFAQAHDLRVVEDACEALGSRYRGRAAGTIGLAGAFGFYPNKQITTGEGGVIVTNDGAVAELCRSLRDQGRDPTGNSPKYLRLGYNYRMTELQAALGLSQLRRLPALMGRRATVASWYRESLANVEELFLPAAPMPGIVMSWFAFAVCLRKEFTEEDRDRILADLRSQGIGCGSYFPAIHLQSYIRERLPVQPGDYPVAERVAGRCLALPFASSLTQDEVAAVVAALLGCLARIPLHRR